MTFKVFGTTGAVSPAEYGDEAHYRIREHGVLEVWTPERKLTYGPAGWSRIEEPRPEDTGGFAGS